MPNAAESAADGSAAGKSGAGDDGTDAAPGVDGRVSAVNAAVGARLRAVRRQRRLALSDVEAASGGEFRISVLGAYERGERGVQVHRLMRLSEIYGVDPAALLPGAASASFGGMQAGAGAAGAADAPPSFPPEAVL